MSALPLTPAPIRPAPRPRPLPAPAPSAASAASGPPVLDAVAAPVPRHSRAPFLLTCVAILLGAMVAVLLMNTAAAKASYEEHDLQAELTRAQAAAQDATEQLEAVAAPNSLILKAKKLGMVPVPVAGYLDLSSGKLLETTAKAKK